MRFPASMMAILLAGLMLSGCSQRVNLVSGLSETEAIDILATLYRHSISAEKVAERSNGIAIVINASDLGRSSELLQEQGLPHPPIEGIGTLFKREGVISSPGEDRIRYYYGISQELSKTLMQIDGVMTARVHIVVPPLGTDGRATAPDSAAILLRHRGEFRGDLDKIKQLVANSVPGLPYSGVTVYLFNSDQRDQFREPLPQSSSGWILVLGGFTAIGIGLAGAGWWYIRRLHAQGRRLRDLAQTIRLPWIAPPPEAP